MTSSTLGWILVIVGAFILLGNFGFFRFNIGRLWPIILVLIGLKIISDAQREKGKPEEAEEREEQKPSLEEAKVEEKIESSEVTAPAPEIEKKEGETKQLSEEEKKELTEEEAPPSGE